MREESEALTNRPSQGTSLPGLPRDLPALSFLDVEGMDTEAERRGTIRDPHEAK